MRKRRAVKRDVLPDPVYKSKVVTKIRVDVKEK